MSTEELILAPRRLDKDLEAIAQERFAEIPMRRVLGDLRTPVDLSLVEPKQSPLHAVLRTL
jgi:hypothetical protein